ncbi:hypothetical protein T484DRAFT_1972006 [Baffinella frigidus]|nr:hypothetical protein T484DRAFT_1972006 [Cryptophyta sp. CCMP2293]
MSWWIPAGGMSAALLHVHTWSNAGPSPPRARRKREKGSTQLSFDLFSRFYFRPTCANATPFRRKDCALHTGVLAHKKPPPPRTLQ